MENTNKKTIRTYALLSISSLLLSVVTFLVWVYPWIWYGLNIPDSFQDIFMYGFLIMFVLAIIFGFIAIYKKYKNNKY